jgi:CRP-like cAMP-binding protein
MRMARNNRKACRSRVTRTCEPALERRHTPRRDRAARDPTGPTRTHQCLCRRVVPARDECHDCRHAIIVADHVVSTLSTDARRRLQPYMEHIRLSAWQQLYDTGDVMRHVLFVEHGVVSLVASTSAGQTTEIAMIGRGNVIAVPSIWHLNTAPCRFVVSFPGDGHRVRADVVRVECSRDVSVQNALVDEAHQMMLQMAQAVVCHRYHTAAQRICRWLLSVSDRVPTNTIPLTQEALGHVIGADRKRVSLAATRLQDEACIRQHRGQIRILNRIGLEQRACDCYRRPTPMTRNAI